jgi:hypothetical protein
LDFDSLIACVCMVICLRVACAPPQAYALVPPLGGISVIDLRAFDRD